MIILCKLSLTPSRIPLDIGYPYASVFNALAALLPSPARAAFGRWTILKGMAISVPGSETRSLPRRNSQQLNASLAVKNQRKSRLHPLRLRPPNLAPLDAELLRRRSLGSSQHRALHLQFLPTCRSRFPRSQLSMCRSPASRRCLMNLCSILYCVTQPLCLPQRPVMT